MSTISLRGTRYRGPFPLLRYTESESESSMDASKLGPLLRVMVAVLEQAENANRATHAVVRSQPARVRCAPAGPVTSAHDQYP
jgi:hypothetical protein